MMIVKFVKHTFDLQNILKASLKFIIFGTLDIVSYSYWKNKSNSVMLSRVLRAS